MVNKPSPKKPYTYYYRVTANNVEGKSIATVSDLTGFNDDDYVTLTFTKSALTERLKELEEDK